MGLGNGNPKNGDRGSNFNYELKVLQGLEAIADALDGGGSSPNPNPLIASGCFSPSITPDSPCDVDSVVALYQKLGNIVQCTIQFTVANATTDLITFTIDGFLFPPIDGFDRRYIYYSITPDRLINETRTLTLGSVTPTTVDVVLDMVNTTNVSGVFSVFLSYPYDVNNC